MRWMLAAATALTVTPALASGPQCAPSGPLTMAATDHPPLAPAAPVTPGCQSALKIDPRSASKIDPARASVCDRSPASVPTDLPIRSLVWRLDGGASVPTETSGWDNCLEFSEVQLADRAQRLGGRGVLKAVRQVFQPSGVLGLQLNKSGHAVVPAPGPAAVIGRTACADHRCTRRACCAVAGLAFGIGHRGFTDRLARHGPTPNRWTERLRRGGGQIPRGARVQASQRAGRSALVRERHYVSLLSLQLMPTTSVPMTPRTISKLAPRTAMLRRRHSVAVWKYISRINTMRALMGAESSKTAVSVTEAARRGNP